MTKSDRSGPEISSEISSEVSPEISETQGLAPEGRRQQALAVKQEINRRLGPETRFFAIVKRVIIGTFNDGFIHAGNLAYLTILAIFPFFILGAALFSLFGEQADRLAMVDAVLTTLPPMVADTIGPVARNVVEARSGWLLWVGGMVGLWTVSSLVETIRDILRRAYGTETTRAFWQYRLGSAGIILLAMMLLMLSLITQVAIGAVQQVIDAYIPLLSSALNDLAISRIVPAISLFGSLYLLFYTLAPHAYRSRAYPKWPGALLVTAWWVAVTVALPPVLRSFFSYDLTYGALSGMMIALFFFWLVGLGVVVGVELNAALARTPEDIDAETAADEAATRRKHDSEDETE